MFFRQRLLPILYRVARALGIDLYKESNIRPDVVADFAGERSASEYYRLGNTEVTFDDMFSYTGASNKVMTDSDGNLKWAPHNTSPYSESQDNVSWSYLTSQTVTTGQSDPFGGSNACLIEAISTSIPDGSIGQNAPGVGVGYSFRFWAKAGTVDYAAPTDASNWWAWFDLTNGVVDFSDDCTASMENAGGGWWLCKCDSITSSINDRVFITIKGSSTNATPWTNVNPASGDNIYIFGTHVYRSDLGGMVDNPDRDDSYVPTTTSAVYLPRRNSYRYQSNAYVNKGITLESAAATNLATESNDFTSGTAAWSGSNTGTLANDATGPDGQSSSATTFVDSAATGTGEVSLTESFTVSTSTIYTFSVYAKADQLNWFFIRANNFTTPASFTDAWFDLSTGSIGTVDAGYDGGALIEDVGNGWYRCSVTFTTDGTDTGGDILLALADADVDTTVDLDGTSSILIYGAQFEASSVPTSYIPTSGATATRAAETLTIAAADMRYNPNAMSFHWKGETSYAVIDAGANNLELFDWRAGSLEYMWQVLRTDGLPTINGRVDTTIRDTTVTTLPEDLYTPGLNIPINIASRFTASVLNAAYDGTADTEVANGAGSIPNLSSSNLTLASDASSSATGITTIALFRKFGADIGDTGIEDATESPYYIEASDSEPKTVADFGGVLSHRGEEYYRVQGLKTTFDGMFTYTGASNKTMVDSDGLLKWAPHNQFGYSSAFDNAAWGKNNCTISTGQTDPDGGSTAFKLVENSGTGNKEIGYDTGGLFIGFAVETAVIAKAAERNWIYIADVGPTKAVWFNLSAGTVGQQDTGMTGSMTDLGDGWYLCKAQTESEVSGVDNWQIGVADADNNHNYTGDGSSGIYIWRARSNRNDLGGMAANPDADEYDALYVPNPDAGAVYLPRRNSYRWDGSTYAKKGITLESAAATNLLTNSKLDDLTTAAANTTLTANNSTSIDGTTNADTVADNGATGSGVVSVNSFVITASAGGTHTLSIYAKAGLSGWFNLKAFNFTSGDTVIQYFNASDGSIGTAHASSSADAFAEDVGNGWYRFGFPFNVDAGDLVGSSQIVLADDDNSASNPSISLDGSHSVNFYGMQFEAGSVPTSLVPTSGATATRSAETLTIAGADMAASTSAMSFQMKGEASYYDNNDATGFEFLRWQTDTNNLIKMRMSTVGANLGNPFYTQIYTGTEDTVNYNTTDVYGSGLNVSYNVAMRNTSSAINGAADGTSFTENATPTNLVDLSSQTLEFGRQGDTSGTLGTHTIALFRQDDNDWTDTGIEEAST